MGHRKGFTLIELLVVIAIIAVLAAILFPVFMTAKARGQQAACAQNMKQIGTAVYTYLQDWNDTYPCNRFKTTGPSIKGSSRNWKTAISGYIKTKGDVWRCPGSPAKNMYDETGAGEPDKAGSIFPCGYALNGAVFNIDENSPAALKLSQIPRPTLMIYIVESRAIYPDLTIGMLDSEARPWNGKRGKNNLNTHRGGNANFIFADTHVVSKNVRSTLVPVCLWNPGSHEHQVTANAVADKLGDAKN